MSLAGEIREIRDSHGPPLSASIGELDIYLAPNFEGASIVATQGECLLTGTLSDNDIDRLIARLADIKEDRAGTTFRQVLRDARDEMLRELAKHWNPGAGRSPLPWDINNGLCEEFMMYVVKRVPDAEERSSEMVDGECTALPGHCWVYWHGRHHDAECIEGVPDWRGLPIFSRLDKEKYPCLKED